jgi:putative transposase
MNTWRAGCSGSCTSGSEGGPQKPTRRKPDRALRPDPYTYVPTRSGMAYVCFIVDAFSRMIVGWTAASHMRTDMVLDALEMARRSRGSRRLIGLVTHSDAGSATHDRRARSHPRRCHRGQRSRRRARR